MHTHILSTLSHLW